MSTAEAKGSRLPPAARGLIVFAALYAFAVSVTLMGSSFKLMSRDAAEVVLTWASNPVLGLMVGLLMTSLVQSSSTVTTMIVTAVAGGLVPLPLAVPMVMGANIGTTVTNTLVALGSVVRTTEFRRSLAAATVHDFFNYIAVLLLLPVEIITQALGVFRSAETGANLGVLGWLGDRASLLFAGVDTTIGLEKSQSGIGFIFKAPAKSVLDALSRFFTDGELATAKALSKVTEGPHEGAVLWAGLGGLLLGLGLLSLCLVVISKNMRKLVLGRFEGVFESRLLKDTAPCIILGAILTVLVQSSSITTSLLVPIASAGLLHLRQVFLFTLGANIGTTCTGLLAALLLVTSGEAGARLGLSIAFVHLFFNATATTLALTIRPLRELPIRLAGIFAETCVRRRSYAVLYLLGAFFGLPCGLLLAWRAVEALI